MKIFYAKLSGDLCHVVVFREVGMRQEDSCPVGYDNDLSNAT